MGAALAISLRGELLIERVVRAERARVRARPDAPPRALRERALRSRARSARGCARASSRARTTAALGRWPSCSAAPRCWLVPARTRARPTPRSRRARARPGRRATRRAARPPREAPPALPGGGRSRRRRPRSPRAARVEAGSSSIARRAVTSASAALPVARCHSLSSDHAREEPAAISRHLRIAARNVSAPGVSTLADASSHHASSSSGRVCVSSIASRAASCASSACPSVSSAGR